MSLLYAKQPVTHRDIHFVLAYIGLYALMAIVSFVGDYLLTLPRPTVAIHYLIALADTTIHGILATLSWSMFVIIYLCFTVFPSATAAVDQLTTLNTIIIIRDQLLCGLLAFLIDFDHVIEAKSFHIKDMTSLKRRPLFHNTVLMSLISLMLILFPWLVLTTTTGTRDTSKHLNSGTGITFMCRLGWLLLVAFVTHHLRDALRHGFNWYPIWQQHTTLHKPVSIAVYYLVLFALPSTVMVLFGLVTTTFNHQQPTTTNDWLGYGRTSPPIITVTYTKLNTFVDEEYGQESIV